jgi:hypothetical protein
MSKVATRLYAAWESPWIVFTILGASLGLNVYLATRPRVNVYTPLESSLKAGATMPAIQADQVGGVRAVLDWKAEGASRPILLYVFTPTCHWCSRNLANIRALATARNGEYRVIGLSLSATGVGECPE